MSKVCPYLIETRPQLLTCRGSEDGISIGIGFSRAKDLQGYQEQYCLGYYPRCMIAQAVNPVWGLIDVGACPYNEAVDCLQQGNCARCGWNPEVAKRRLGL